MSSRSQWLFMAFDTGDIGEDMRTVYDVTALISLMTGSLYFATTLSGPQVFPGSMSHNRTDVVIPTSFRGFEVLDGRGVVDGLVVPNDSFARLLGRVDELGDLDRGHVVSAAALLRDAKVLLFRGEDSAAVAVAVSAVEALYVRPDSQGIFHAVDSRFPELKSLRMAERFSTLFAAGGPDNQRLITTINPYAVRSGHLHAGEIRLFHGDPSARREDDDLVAFVGRCQDVIVETIHVLEHGTR